MTAEGGTTRQSSGWTSVERGLASYLAGMTVGDHLVINTDIDPGTSGTAPYAQFALAESGEIRSELAGDGVLGAQWRHDETTLDELLRHGWCRPTSQEDGPNLFRYDDPTCAEIVAASVVGALSVAWGISDASGLGTRCWGPTSADLDLRLPVFVEDLPDDVCWSFDAVESLWRSEGFAGDPRRRWEESPEVGHPEPLLSLLPEMASPDGYRYAWDLMEAAARLRVARQADVEPADEGYRQASDALNDVYGNVAVCNDELPKASAGLRRRGQLGELSSRAWQLGVSINTDHDTDTWLHSNHPNSPLWEVATYTAHEQGLIEREPCRRDPRIWFPALSSGAFSSWFVGDDYDHIELLDETGHLRQLTLGSPYWSYRSRQGETQ